MERLTYRRTVDNAVCIKDINCDNIPEKVQEITNRLAAYEDTGLEPDEIIAVTGLASTNCSKTADAIDKLLSWDTELEAYRALGTVEEMAALAKAKAEGLLVVLPCKPNATFLHRNYNDGGLELNIEIHDFGGCESDLDFEERDQCACWE